MSVLNTGYLVTLAYTLSVVASISLSRAGDRVLTAEKVRSGQRPLDLFQHGLAIGQHKLTEERAFKRPRSQTFRAAALGSDRMGGG